MTAVAAPANAGFASLDALVRPRSVAVIGASDEPARIGGRPIAYMKERGFDGALWPVNPKRATVQGLPAFAAVEALPAAPDVAIIAVPADQVTPTLDALGRKGCRAVIVFSAGFAEMDEAGAAAQDRLTAVARGHGIRMLGPNCLGVFNDSIRFYGTFTASFEKGFPIPGNIGIVSQSGAYGTHVFSAALDRGLGAPVVITTGNEAEVALGDALGWMAQAPEVEVICAYAEGIRESAQFIAALDLARRNRKPIVMMKVGRSQLGGAAAKSHTASIAGDDTVTQAVLDEFGVVRARTTEEMLDIAYAATKRIYPARNTLGVLTVSGGAGVLISDAAEQAGVEMPPMPEEAQARLRGLVPFCAPRNPVDCTAQVTNNLPLISEFAESVARDGGYTSILSFWSQTAAGRSVGPSLQEQMRKVRTAHPDRLWVMSMLAPNKVRDYEADGWICFEDPSRAVNAIAAMGRFGAAFARAADAAPGPSLPAVTLPAATPSEAVAKALLDAAGVPAVPEHACSDSEAAVMAADRIGYPVVLKILSPDILHKSEIGGVLLDVGDAAAVRQGFGTLLDRARRHAPAARIEGVLVAKQIKGAVEMALGVLRDPVFGPVAMVGLGGVFIEVLKDVGFRRCPFDAAEAERMIRGLRGFPLLDGARGRPKADVAALARALSALSAFAVAAGPRLAGVDVNPLLVLPDGQGCFAADAVVEVDG
ncbi:acetate--CoA ligase family protein [Paracraurococcus ruber]|uniref:Acyl-CoA synthetase n=1 Tax=Paracraurococcus ruber TaxID=77675 RepID=A0ABS1D6J9_9PROT|nr:acetate--CoA ligase family protein [Paracraurococcus ruber]MBK1662517.1 acyl-CoA synthetase [Paracraurococcus ruber]TDG13134.1 CoA-binding protein [Paracraurococcus ruber]